MGVEPRSGLAGDTRRGASATASLYLMPGCKNANGYGLLVGLGRVANRLLRPLGYRLRPLEPTHRESFGKDADAVIDSVRTFTMTTPARIAALHDAVRYVVRRSVKGALVECGVWRGGSSMAMALALMAEGVSRDIYLFDTFSGMPPPSDVDRNSLGESAKEVLLHSDPDRSLVWAKAGLEEVEQNMRSTGYDIDKVHFVSGMVEDTVPSQAPDHIAVLRLDTDWYQSTKHELLHLYPRLAPGGVLIIDDYGDWEGARRAVDEHLASLDVPLYLHRIDATGRLLVKP